MSETTIRRPAKSSSAAVSGNGAPALFKTARESRKPRDVMEPPVDELAEVRTRQVLVAIMAFRDGDFSVRLPRDWGGTEGRIAEAFNQAIGHEDRIAREVMRLSSTVGKEGRLQQRMSVPGAVGGWATKVEALNTLLDDLVRPTTEPRAPKLDDTRAGKGRPR